MIPDRDCAITPATIGVPDTDFTPGDVIVDVTSPASAFAYLGRMKSGRLVALGANGTAHSLCANYRKARTLQELGEAMKMPQHPGPHDYNCRDDAIREYNAALAITTNHKYGVKADPKFAPGTEVRDALVNGPVGYVVGTRTDDVVIVEGRSSHAFYRIPESELNVYAESAPPMSFYELKDAVGNALYSCEEFDFCGPLTVQQRVNLKEAVEAVAEEAQIRGVR